MGKIKKAAKAVSEVLDILERYPISAVKAYAKKAGKKLGDTWNTEKELRKKLKQLSDDELDAVCGSVGASGGRGMSDRA